MNTQVYTEMILTPLLDNRRGMKGAQQKLAKRIGETKKIYDDFFSFSQQKRLVVYEDFFFGFCGSFSRSYLLTTRSSLRVFEFIFQGL